MTFCCFLVAFYKSQDEIARFRISLKKNGEKYAFSLKKCLDHVLLMTPYLYTIATDCRQTLPKCLKDKRTATEDGMG